MKKLIINGMVLTQERKVGVPRFVNELLKSLDRKQPSFDVEILVPFHVEQHYRHLKKIILPIQRADNKIQNMLWQAVVLPRYAKKAGGVLVQPAMGYGLFKNDILIVYDLQPEHFPDNYTTGSPLYMKAKQELRAQAIRKCGKIITISNYVKEDLIHTYGIQGEKIDVVPCGWQHFKRVDMDDSVFLQYPVLENKKGCYYFSLGSRYAHKNQRWVYEAAKKHPESLFVITGYNDVTYYSEKLVQEAPKNVLFTGYLPDGQVKALMKHCKAFLHPSLSEGFGIPPMEALSEGVPVIISNTTSLPEIYGNTAHYIDPCNYTDIDLDSVLSEHTEAPDALLEKYSWDNAAEAFLRVVEPVLY